LGLLMLLGIKTHKYKHKHALSIGGLIGFNKALTGGGFGPIAVAGLNVAGMETKKSLGTTLLAEGITCTLSLILYFILGKLTIVLSFLIPLVLGALIGSYLGARHTKKVKADGFTKKVGIAITLLGLFVLLKTFIL